jgi:hypothetical protein
MADINSSTHLLTVALHHLVLRDTVKVMDNQEQIQVFVELTLGKETFTVKGSLWQVDRNGRLPPRSYADRTFVLDKTVEFDRSCWEDDLKIIVYADILGTVKGALQPDIPLGNCIVDINGLLGQTRLSLEPEPFSFILKGKATGKVHLSIEEHNANAHESAGHGSESSFSHTSSIFEEALDLEMRRCRRRTSTSQETLKPSSLQTPHTTVTPLIEESRLRLDRPCIAWQHEAKCAGRLDNFCPFTHRERTSQDTSTEV